MKCVVLIFLILIQWSSFCLAQDPHASTKYVKVELQFTKDASELKIWDSFYFQGDLEAETVIDNEQRPEVQRKFLDDVHMNCTLGFRPLDCVNDTVYEVELEISPKPSDWKILYLPKVKIINNEPLLIKNDRFLGNWPKNSFVVLRLESLSDAQREVYKEEGDGYNERPWKLSLWRESCREPDLKYTKDRLYDLKDEEWWDDVQYMLGSRKLEDVIPDKDERDAYLLAMHSATLATMAANWSGGQRVVTWDASSDDWSAAYTGSDEIYTAGDYGAVQANMFATTMLANESNGIDILKESFASQSIDSTELDDIIGSELYGSILPDSAIGAIEREIY